MLLEIKYRFREHEKSASSLTGLCGIVRKGKGKRAFRKSKSEF